MREKVSNNFYRDEFACGDGCGFDTADVKLIDLLESGRAHFRKKYPDRNVTVDPNSAARCAKHNKAEGGGEFSQHLLGKACDPIFHGVHPDEVCDYYEEKYPGQLGIGRYKGRSHLDVRNGGNPTTVNPIPAPARWDKR